MLKLTLDCSRLHSALLFRWKARDREQTKTITRGTLCMKTTLYMNFISCREVAREEFIYVTPRRDLFLLASNLVSKM